MNIRYSSNNFKNTSILLSLPHIADLNAHLYIWNDIPLHTHLDMYFTVRHSSFSWFIKSLIFIWFLDLSQPSLLQPEILRGCHIYCLKIWKKHPLNLEPLINYIVGNSNTNCFCICWISSSGIFSNKSVNCLLYCIPCIRMRQKYLNCFYIESYQSRFWLIYLRSPYFDVIFCLYYSEAEGLASKWLDIIWQRSCYKVSYCYGSIFMQYL